MKIYNLIHFEFFSINHNFIRSVPLVIHFEEKITCIFRKISKSPHRLLSIFQASIELATYFSENQRAVTAVALCLWCEAVKSGGMSSDISSREMTNLLRVPLSSSQALRSTHTTQNRLCHFIRYSQSILFTVSLLGCVLRSFITSSHSIIVVGLHLSRVFFLSRLLRSLFPRLTTRRLQI